MCVYGTKDFVRVKDAQGYLLSQTWRSVCFSDARCNSRSYKITTQIWVINCKFRNLDEQQAIEWDVIYKALCSYILCSQFCRFQIWLYWDKSPGKMNLWVNELCCTSDWLIWMCFHWCLFPSSSTAKTSPTGLLTVWGSNGLGPSHQDTTLCSHSGNYLEVSSTITAQCYTMEVLMDL